MYRRGARRAYPANWAAPRHRADADIVVRIKGPMRPALRPAEPVPANSDCFFDASASLLTSIPPELADLVQQRRNLDNLGLDKRQDKFETKENLWNDLLRWEQQRISP